MPLIPKLTLVESHGFCPFMWMLAGKLTDKTGFTAEKAGGKKGAALIACLCLTAAKHSPWPKPNCNPMILICPITSFSCFLLIALYVCASICVYLPGENRGFVVTVLSDAAVCASDVFTQRMKWIVEGNGGRGWMQRRDSRKIHVWVCQMCNFCLLQIYSLMTCWTLCGKNFTLQGQYVFLPSKHWYSVWLKKERVTRDIFCLLSIDILYIVLIDIVWSLPKPSNLNRKILFVYKYIRRNIQ